MRPEHEKKNEKNAEKQIQMDDQWNIKTNEIFAKIELLKTIFYSIIDRTISNNW